VEYQAGAVEKNGESSFSEIRDHYARQTPFSLTFSDALPEAQPTEQ
jgi:hypothetical protein